MKVSPIFVRLLIFPIEPQLVPGHLPTFFLVHSAKAPTGLGFLVVEASPSHLIEWTSDQPDPETSTWHTTLTRNRYLCLGRDLNPQSLHTYALDRAATRITTLRTYLMNYTNYVLTSHLANERTNLQTNQPSTWNGPLLENPVVSQLFEKCTYFVESEDIFSHS
jgi:hypothetical protein